MSDRDQMNRFATEGIGPMEQTALKSVVCRSERPFEDLSETELFKWLEEALAAQRIDLEIVSLVCQELRHTGGKVRDARRMIRKAGGREIRWLTGARYRVKNIAENYDFENGARNCKVYFILLTDDRETPMPWGLYIGQTFRKIETRFEQHLDLTHPRHSGVVARRGRELLYSPRIPQVTC